jgi:hypothetical protein
MIKKRNINILLLFAAMVTVMCRCYVPYSRHTIIYSDHSLVDCRNFRESASNGTPAASGMTCPLICPDGSEVEYDLYDGGNGTYSKEELQAQYCTIEATATVPPPATATVTATVSSAAKAAPQPVLDGKVSACDRTQGFINFGLASTAGDLTGKKLVVSLNGVEVKCAVAGSNNQLLGCSLPASITFPVPVKVTLDGTVVNEFTHDGSGCTTSGGGQGDSPAPTIDPTTY